MRVKRRELLLAAAAILLAAPRAGLAMGLRDVSPEDAYLALQSDASIIVLDIRTPGEFATGHVEGALNIDYYARDFPDRIQALDPNQTYMVYCQKGVRSRSLMRALIGSQFDDVLHIAEGFDGWRNKGLPFVR